MSGFAMIRTLIYLIPKLELVGSKQDWEGSGNTLCFMSDDISNLIDEMRFDKLK
jgi:hypothetical protein